MINRTFQHNGIFLLFTLAVACCLLFTGMRVPDFGHPHRPKSSQRAVLENQAKTTHQAVKKSLEVFDITAKAAVPGTPLPYRTDFRTAFQPGGFPPLFPNSSRAPPLFPA